MPKALVRDGNGRTLLARAVETAGAAGLPSLVAVRADDAAVAEEARRCGARIVEVEGAEEGMAASIRAGVAAVGNDPQVEGVLILLVDQWRVGADDLRRLLAAWMAHAKEIGQRRRADAAGAGEGVVAGARYGEVIGVPAVFGRDFFNVLLGLDGDRGARDFLRSGDPAIGVVDIPPAADDVDTMEELSSLAGGAGPPAH